MQINVGNLRTTTQGIRCDRSSFLGNPFQMETENDRHATIKAFRQYLKMTAIDLQEPSIVASQVSIAYKLNISSVWKRPTSRQLLKELERVYELGLTQEITLLCWCAPLPCHCNVLINYFKWRMCEIQKISSYK
ncbi:MAG: DUF4326 domain-containing protein [Chamaesiphon sp. CSU_1_12]|nr:DUF4326 domain-containing protein [Chamaesiphon sp. CSU_1_12]